MDASEAWRIGNDAAAVEEEEEVNLRGEDEERGEVRHSD